LGRVGLHAAQPTGLGRLLCAAQRTRAGRPRHAAVRAHRTATGHGVRSTGGAFFCYVAMLCSRQHADVRSCARPADAPHLPPR
jgi:hypothetical protein